MRIGRSTDLSCLMADEKRASCNHSFEELESIQVSWGRRVEPRSGLRAIPIRRNLLPQQATAMTSLIRRPTPGAVVSTYPSKLYITSGIEKERVW